MPISTGTNLRAVDIWFTDDMLYVRLSDDREVGVPLKWYPKLLNADPHQRSSWRLIGNGIGIHWNDLDEDISVQGMIYQ
jgi:hypothetical protein